MGALATLFSRIRGVPTGRILGRQTSGTGRAEALTAEELRTLVNVPDVASSLDQQFVGTITWTGSVAPSGTVTARYSWTRVGKLVYFEFRFQWTVNGSGNTAAEWHLPDSFPPVATVTGQDNSEIMSWVHGGAGQLNLGESLTGNMSEARLQRNSSGATVVRLRFVSNGAATMVANGVYRCA